MRIEELTYNEGFWIALKRVLKQKKGWAIEFIDNIQGRIIKKGQMVALFRCPANEDPKIEVRQKESLEDLVNLSKELELELTRDDLRNFKRDIIVKKDWSADDLI
jgi:hypothetical protein